MAANPARHARDIKFVRSNMPSNTTHQVISSADVYTFHKRTQVGVSFVLSIYYDQDEGGYSAQVVSPAIERSLQGPHVGHLFDNGIICMGTKTMRACHELSEAYARACLWSEGMAIMIKAREHGQTIAFPFSANSQDDDPNSIWRR